MHRVKNHAGFRLKAPTRPTFAFVDGSTAMPSGQASRQKVPTGGPSLPVVIYCHGLNSDPDEMMGAQRGLTDGLAALGFYVIAVAMHDPPTQYANDIALADIEEGVTFARAHGAAATGRVYVGFSGGGQDVFISAAAHLADTRCIAAFAPLIDPNGWFLLNAGGIVQTAMNNAYSASPAGGWAANRAQRDPSARASDFASTPSRIWYGTGITTSWNFGAGNVSTDGDGIIASQSVTDFRTAVGSACSIEACAGAGHFTPNPLGLSVPAAALAGFVAQHVAIPSEATQRLALAA